MKALFFCLLAVALPSTAMARVDVQIEEVGLKGYYSTHSPTPVRVRVTPDQSGTIRLEFKVSSNEDEQGTLPVRVDRFSFNVDVVSNVAMELDVPVPFIGSLISSYRGGVAGYKLEVTAFDAAYHDVGSSSIGLKSLELQNGRGLIAIICGDRRLCDEAQSQVTFSGSTEDVAKKNGALKFIALDGPREHWWDYAAAGTVVVAGPLSGWTRENRDALEYYGRADGTLVLLEKEIDDPTFLSSYRADGFNNQPRALGLGRLYPLPSLESKTLGMLFAGGGFERMQNPVNQQYSGPLVEWLRNSVGMSFSFPRLRWLLGWLIVYILVVGVANFALLRRWRRLEWGWVTTSVIAILFAVGLYVASSAHRPSKVILDDIAVYWMDAQSPIAREDIALRISTPERQAIGVSIGDGAMLHLFDNSYDREVPTAEIANEITEERHHQQGWDVSLGPPFQTTISLLRWSSSDLNFATFHVFPGSVTLSSGSQLKNSTGENFQQALYFDFPGNKRCIIPRLGAGEEIDITNLACEAIYFEGKNPNDAGGEVVKFSIMQYSGPAPLKDIPIGFKPASTRHAFVGLSQEPVPVSSLSLNDFDRHNFALTVVSLDQP
jgi:hypothetical protein